MSGPKRGEWVTGLEAADVADTLHIRVLRTLNELHVTDALDRCAVLTDLLTRLEALREQNGLQAISNGESYATLARAMGVTRQSAREWAKARGE